MSAGVQTEILCPFFKALGRLSIICESPVRTAISSSTYFSSYSKRQSHIIWHCNAMDGAGCPVYNAVMQKYADDKKEQP